MKEANYEIINFAIATLIKGEKINKFAIGILEPEVRGDAEKLKKVINEKIKEENRIAFFDTLADSIISTHSAKTIYLFSLYFDELPILRMEEALMKIREYVEEMKTEEYVVKFAKFVEGAHVKKLAKHILKWGNSKEIYEFARDVPNAPIKELADAIMLTNNFELIAKFAVSVPNAPKGEMLEYVVKG